jgi:hypothetical protein
MRVSTATPTLGYALAAITGVLAVAAIGAWPHERHNALAALAFVWTLIGAYGMGGPRYSLRLTPRELYRQIVSSKHRSSLSEILFLLIVLALWVYVSVSS